MTFGAEPVFDNRELAVGLWILVAFICAVARQGTRASLFRVLRAASTPKIAVPLLLLVGYALGLVGAFWSLHLWTWDLLSETIFWFVGTALVLFMANDRATRDPRFFRRISVRVLSLTVILQFVVNLFSLSLVAELALVPAAAGDRHSCDSAP